jgi:beta-galactosidase
MVRFTLAAVLLVLASQSFSQAGRERKLLDFGWRFHLGNSADVSQDFGYGLGMGLAKAGEAVGAAGIRFDDSGWRSLNLPHDWVVELPFNQQDDGLHVAHGSKPVGREYSGNSIGWYRRTFDIPESDLGRRISVEFDGVYRDSQVWINGHLLGREPSGYSGFSYDLTDYLNYGGRNVLVVRADATQFEGWFYEGGGIYRHVWLLKTAPVHVAEYGTYVTSEIGRGSATLKVQTEIANDSDADKSVTLHSKVIDPAGKDVGGGDTASVKVPAGTTSTVTQVIRVSNPQLWSVETPMLYKMVSYLSGDPDAEDQYETNFGIRSISFDPDKGFFLNGKRVEIKGVCNHQDHAGVGSALPDRLNAFRVAKLKEFGANAYRTSHNPPTPELLDECDKQGMLVMDENRLIGASPWIEDQLRRQIRRDRNHPSVILWSIGNEENEESSARGERIAKSMVNLCHRLDPTRPTTFAGNNGNNYSGVNGQVDVRGWNYMAIGKIDDYQKDHPKQPMLGSEEASTLSTRGEYANDKGRGYVSAYDTEKPGWGSLAEDWWTYYAARPYLAGAFVWTGFDYRGEPTPYAWPCISSHFGVLDTCGFPKDNAYYYKAWWTNEPMIHILPHWNWGGKEGQNISVWVYSNLEEIELVLNGKSLGRKPMPRNSHLEWQVAYQPGALEARAFKGGKLVKSEKVETTRGASAISLTPDRKEIDANGEDVAIYTVAAVDDHGRVVPDASNDISFKVTGGHILGVGNGNPTSHENDVYLPYDQVIASYGWRFNPTVPADVTPFLADDYDASDWRPFNVNGQADLVHAKESAMYLGGIDLPGIEKGSKVILTLSQFGDHGEVYVNGVRAGGATSGVHGYSFDVNTLVHPGHNLIFVVVRNEGSSGGLGGGVSIHLTGPQPVWHRQVFHGLAQIIVQGETTPGQIKLTATSPGLKQADSVVETRSAAFRGL